MALTFPSSPSNGQIYADTTTGNRYIYNATAGVWSFAANNVGMSVSSTPPSNVAPGSMWYNREIGRTFVYYDDGDSKQWVETVPAGTIDTNTIASYVNPVFASMNTAYATANAGFGKANTALQNTSGTFAGDLSISGNIDTLVSNKANSVIGLRIVGNTTSSLTAPSIRVIGYNTSYELLNKDYTQNWYFGCADDDNKALYIGRGYGPKQGVTPAIKVDINDRITMYNQPMFFAISNGSSIMWNTQPFANSFPTIYNSLNTGYNASTSTFTAPVAGKYMFSGNIRGDRSDSAYFYVDFWINGSSFYGSSGALVGLNTNVSAAGFIAGAFIVIIKLSANDTVTIGLGSNQVGPYAVNSQSYWMGYLLG